MIDDSADGRGCTDIVDEARVQALVLNAGLCRVTVAVDKALNLLTELVGIADQAWRARAP